MNGDGRPARLAVNIDDAMRSISASPQPPQSPSSFIQGEDSYGEGDDSQFGKAKKSKRKAAPRTSRACLACQVDCMFERRSDYLLNPEDRAWQNGVEKRLEHLGKAIDQILAHLGGGPVSMPSTAATYPEMPQTAFYDHHPFDRSAILPNTAPLMSDASAQGRINYVIPTSSETAAIAAQSRLKRPRGNTVPSNLASGGFTPDTGFQLFSPRTATVEQGTPYHFQVAQQHLHTEQAPYSHSHSYSLDTYANGSSAADLHVSVPRSLTSPTVRFASPAVPLMHPAPHSISSELNAQLQHQHGSSSAEGLA
ncbi:MAG: hypothetical protein CYPHOPRED_000905 [Cyphobasidiales sp. Tagirdzhanova-0007]|nr:MAG: hypothetical protein CYPHOPRED_000905 [Cyphobasidiales sp. Tagirdzhanova-0007]